jgi:uncharacterized protein DUF2786
MPDADPMVTKINALLTKAERASTSEEAQAYTAKAAHLMAVHGIEAHMLAAAMTKAQSTSRRPATEKFTMARPFTHQRKDLLVQVGGALSLHPVIFRDPSDKPGQYRETIRVSLFGSEADIARARTLWTSTMLQAFHVMQYELPKGSGSSAKQSWLQGWAAAVGQLLRNAEKQAATQYDQEHKLEGGHSTALVLADWDDVVTAFRAQLHPSLGRARHRGTSGNQYSSGFRAGLRADLGRTGVGGQSGRSLTR